MADADQYDALIVVRPGLSGGWDVIYGTVRLHKQTEDEALRLAWACVDRAFVTGVRARIWHAGRGEHMTSWAERAAWVGLPQARREHAAECRRLRQRGHGDGDT